MLPIPRFPTTLTRRAASAAALVLSVAALAAWPARDGFAQTQAHSEIAALLQASNAAQALTQADAALAQDPRDPQLQFLKANAELALGQHEAADATLTHITQTYPELPEPWNNLAVIRAGQGQLDEAHQLLQQALRNNPDYAQAHANLADVLVQLALRHLESAERLAPQATTAQRLQALRQSQQPQPTRQRHPRHAVTGRSSPCDASPIRFGPGANGNFCNRPTH